MPKRRGRGRRGSIATSGNKIQCSPANIYGKGVTEKNIKVLQVQDYKYSPDKIFHKNRLALLTLHILAKIPVFL